MNEDRIKNEFEKLFNKGLTTKQKTLKILNVYRNFYYTDGNNTERGIIANAINDILPDLVKLIEEKKLDYSDTCNKDDDDLANPCFKCINFCFPIGCMLGEEDSDEKNI